jgi:hypothetical protein
MLLLNKKTTGTGTGICTVNGIPVLMNLIERSFIEKHMHLAEGIDLTTGHSKCKYTKVISY